MSQTETVKPLRCKRTSLPLTKDARARMLANRRLQQRSRTPGFTEVRSLRINGLMQAMAISVSIEWTALKKKLVEREIQEEAYKRVSRSLPIAEHSHLYRYRPSKNDVAGYRGEGGLGPVRLAALQPVAAPKNRVRKAKAAAL
jgi:hypothetical protein